MAVPSEILEFLLTNFTNEWHEFFTDLGAFTPEALLWQPAPRLHSAGWHLRHLVEWRYAAIHVMICRKPNEERLFCLGWENDQVIRKLAANPSEWFEPRFSPAEHRQFAEKVRDVTEGDLKSLPPARYFEVMHFSWGQNTVLNEILEEAVRHSALHRGHARELKKLWAHHNASH